MKKWWYNTFFTSNTLKNKIIMRNCWIRYVLFWVYDLLFLSIWINFIDVFRAIKLLHNFYFILYFSAYKFWVYELINYVFYFDVFRAIKFNNKFFHHIFYISTFQILCIKKKKLFHFWFYHHKLILYII